MFYKIVTRNLIPSGRVARKDHHCKGTSWLPPTFGRLTSSLQPTSWCPKVPSPPSEIRQGFFGLIIQINQWLLISPDHKAEVAGVKAGHGFMDLFLRLEATPRFECLVICRFQPFIFQGVIVLKHDNKKVRCCWLRGELVQNRVIFIPRKKNRPLIKTKLFTSRHRQEPCHPHQSHRRV